MSGIITEVQRFSLNDGPGIRTTVFFKGCNLKCPWCHNPETIPFGKSLHYYPSKCISCYKCVYACTNKAHKRIDNVHNYYPVLCSKCGKCASICYAGAMAVSGTEVTVKSVMDEIIQDIPYYKTSGGGVTLSGGEVLCQSEFACEICDACHELGIHVAIESNICFPWEKASVLLSEVDYIMCDLKLIDSNEHKRYTGIGNENILENIRLIDTLGKDYVIRTPLIPRVTASDENIRGVSEFIKKTCISENFRFFEMLNFNLLGNAKYVSLKKENPFREERPLSEERLDQLMKIALGNRIKVKIS